MQATQAEIELAAAIEDMYTTFAHYRLRPGLELRASLLHQVAAAEVERIRAKTLRDLSWDELNRYAHRALTTWGDDHDLCH